MRDRLQIGGRFIFECYRDAAAYRDGRPPLWREPAPNIVVDVGIEYIMASSLAGGAQVSSFYVGLTGATPVPDPGDTTAVHAGWTEYLSYSEASRQIWQPTLTAELITNAASKAVFTINAPGQTIGGAFLAAGATKGETSSTLIAVGAFVSGNKTPSLGQMIVVTYEIGGIST